MHSEQDSPPSKASLKHDKIHIFKRNKKMLPLFFWRGMRNEVMFDTLFAHMSPQALQRVLGPSGPRRIIGVDFSLIPQCRQLQASKLEVCMDQSSNKHDSLNSSQTGNHK